MTLQALAIPLIWPGNILYGGTAPALGNGTQLNAATEYDATYITAHEAMTITHVSFKCQAVPTTPQVNVKIETITAATGHRTGTNWNTNTQTGPITPSTTHTAFPLTAPAIIAAGQTFAVVILHVGGDQTISTTGNVVGSFAMPYAGTNTGGSDAKSAILALKGIALHSSANTFYPIRCFRPAAAASSNAFNNTNSAKRGMRFQLPFKAKICGIRYWPGAAIGDFNIGLENDSGTELSSSETAFEGDVHAAVSNGMGDFFFDSPVEVSANTFYVAYIEPASATNCNMYTATLPTSGATAAEYRGAWPGGTNCRYTTYTSGGGWVESTTDVPFMDLMISQLDDGVGGGGGASVGHIIGG